MLPPFAIAIEVLLPAGFVGSFVSALEGHRTAFAAAFTTTAVRRKLTAAHLGALLLQDGFARQLNAIAVDGQHFHQNLIAFFQFIANIVDAMLSNFA